MAWGTAGGVWKVYYNIHNVNLSFFFPLSARVPAGPRTFLWPIHSSFSLFIYSSFSLLFPS